MMTIRTKQFFSAVLFLFLALTLIVRAENKPGRHTAKTNSAPYYSKLNLNRLSTYLCNDGTSDNTPLGNSGLEFPRGSGTMVVYMSGFVWGATVDDSVHVGGATFGSGLQPGRIISPGVAEDPGLEKNRIYRVRPDYKTADLSVEMSEEGKSESEVRSRYEKDWMEWPASEGAPFVDKDGDGRYDPQKDIPGIINAVQTIWFVANDLDASKTRSFYGSAPIGIEMQVTAWALDRDWMLRNMYFKKYRLINKSNSTFKNMYVSSWSDQDLGDAQDDFAGCDSLLNLSFVYNATTNDAIYGPNPPAVGCSFLQGPLVNGAASDSGTFEGKWVRGKKNLPISSSFFFINNPSDYVDPTIGEDYGKGALRWYNIMQGKLSISGKYYPLPPSLGQGTTKFPLSGDPVKGTGYLDGELIPKGDRRGGITAGPFDMAPGETQEIVLSEMVARSSNNINAVKLLKVFAAETKKKFNENFKFQEPAAPEAPKISATYSEHSVTLNIPADALVEDFDKEGFKFQGYNVYQLSSGVPDKYYGISLKTMDKIDGVTFITGSGVDTLTGGKVNLLQQKGTDSGILRALTFTRDSLGHAPFLIGKKYFFGVSAYTYRNDPVNNLTNTESPLGVVVVTFQDSLPGLKYNDALKITRISGRGEGTITPIVIDPAKLTGDMYQIGFDSEGGNPKLYLRDITRGGYTVTDNQSELYGGYLSPVYDGIYIKVDDIRPGVKDWQIPQGTLKWSSSGAKLGLEGFNGAIGYGDTWLGTTASVERLHNVLIKFASTDSSGNILNPGDPNVSYAYRYMRSSNLAPAKPEFAQYIINKGSGYAYQDYVRNFPFAAYDMETFPPMRLCVGYLENNSIGGLLDGKYWPPKMGEDNVGVSGPREWFFIFDLPYGETAAPSLQQNLLSGILPVLYMGTPTRISGMTFSSEDQFLIIRNHPFTSEDKFTFQLDRQTSVANSESIPLTYEMSQNYPNPFNPVTTIRYSLPEASRVELKVYDILGREVMTLVNREQNAGKYNVQFDAGRLSSGIYIYRISAKNFTRTNKMVLLK